MRFIKDDCIVEVLADELSDDEYVLGCFKASFLSKFLNCPTDVIEKLQESEAFESIGYWVNNYADLEEIAETYAGLDGYGHHFNSYDGSSEEIEIYGDLYHVFDNH